MKVSELLTSVNQKEKNKALQLPVRELEQESKGHFIAFVDEGEFSHDVKLVMQASTVVESACDCINGDNLCMHKVAVLLAIEGSKVVSKTTVKAKGKKKKLSEAEEVMLGMDKEAITNWIAEVFKKNKPLEQLFVLTFSTEEKTFTASQVQELMEQTIKSVAGRRKTLEGANVKKLMDLMKIALEPVNHYVTVNINKPIAHNIFVVVLDTINAFDRRIRTYSKKIESFYEEYTNWYALTINNIQEKSVWEEAIKWYVYLTFEHIVNESVICNTFNDAVIKELYHSSTQEQKAFIAKELMRCISSLPVKRHLLDFTYVLFLKEVALDQGVYSKVQEFFTIDIDSNRLRVVK